MASAARTADACMNHALADINARLLSGTLDQFGRVKGNAQMALKLLDMGRADLAREYLVEAVDG